MYNSINYLLLLLSQEKNEECLRTLDNTLAVK